MFDLRRNLRSKYSGRAANIAHTRNTRVKRVQQSYTRMHSSEEAGVSSKLAYGTRGTTYPWGTKQHSPENCKPSRLNSHVAACDCDSLLNTSSGRHIVLLAPLGSAAYFEDPCGLLLTLKALVRPLVSQFSAPPSKLCGRNRCQKLAPQPADDQISSEIRGAFRQSLCCQPT